MSKRRLLKLSEHALSKKGVIGWILFIAWCGFILWITLLSRKAVYTERVFRPDLFYEFREIIIGAENGMEHTKLFFENVLLFVPFGFLFPWKKHWRTVILFGVMSSLLIEFIQYILMIGEFEVDDIISNTLGALIGNTLHSLLIVLKKR